MNGSHQFASEQENAESEPAGAGADAVLLRLASEAHVFRCTSGRLHARVPVEHRDETLDLRGRAFRSWLVDGHWKETGELPSQSAVSRVICALEARTRSGTSLPAVCVRVGADRDENESSYYLDLGDSSGRAVKISAAGWSIVNRPPVYFKRPGGMLPLPLPSRDGSIDLLRPFVNLSDEDFRLLTVWMIAALRPVGPYPVLVLHGEQGSAKSTLTRIIAQLIDPQAAPLLAEPESTRDLMVSAFNGWLLAFDNISTLSNRLSDAICRVATGGGFASRKLNANDERHVIHAERPIVLNGIDEFARRSDLVDRMLPFDLPPIEPSQRQPQEEFWAAFSAVSSRILGGLLDALVGGLRELSSVKLAALPRMADFARFGEAVGRALGWPAGTFISAYIGKRRESAATALHDSLVVHALFALAARTGASEWTHSPSELLELLEHVSAPRTIRSPRWPKTPSLLGNELRRIAPQLRTWGVNVTFGKARTSRKITVSFELPSGPADYSGATP